MDKTAYFTSRTSVGQQFADDLTELRYENTAILALSPGGVVIAVEIAKKIHAIAGLLLLKQIYIPGSDQPIGVINDHGQITYSENISAVQLEDFLIEYRGSIESGKMQAVHDLHVIGQKGTMTPHYFKGRTVIIVDDFAKTGTAYHAALEFLKPVRTEKIILVAAVARVEAIDVMHRLGDKLLISHTTDKDLPPEHYFTDNSIPQTNELLQLMEQIVLQW